MKLLGITCPDGHTLGNITYKTEIDSTKRKLVRKLIDDVFYCQQCKKFFKLSVTEVEFKPKLKEVQK